METIIVEIYIPAITQSFDFRLPASGRVCDVIDEIIRILEITQDRADAVRCRTGRGAGPLQAYRRNRPPRQQPAGAAVTRFWHRKVAMPA